MRVQVIGPARSGKTTLISAAIGGFIASGIHVAFVTVSKQRRYTTMQAQKQMEQLNPKLTGLLTVLDGTTLKSLSDFAKVPRGATVIIEDEDVISQQLLDGLMLMAKRRQCYVITALRTQS